MSIKTALMPVGRLVSRVGLKCKKYYPEIFLGLGVVGVIGGAVALCKESRHVDDIMAVHHEKMQDIDDMIERASENPDIEYTDKMIRGDRAKTYVMTGKELVKNYWPGVLMTASGIVCFFVSYGILHKRNAALMAAYSALDRSYKALEKKIKEKYGDEALEDLKDDVDEVVDMEEDGTVKKSKVVTNKMSPFARCFDEKSRWYRRDAELNRSFVISTQNWANDKLKSQGHLFLNEVYDALDIPRSKEGQIVGWVLNSKTGDRYVDFDIFDTSNEKKSDFLLRYERAIWLDFNVDGVIYDMI